MSELRTAGTLADCPDVGCGGFESIVDLEPACLVCFNAGQFEVNSGCIRSAARCDQDVAADNCPVSLRGFHGKVNFSSGAALDTDDVG